MRVIQKNTEIIQRKDIDLKYLEDIYIKGNNREKIIIVYDEKKYWTLIHYDLLRWIHTEYELNLYLNVDCCHEYLLSEDDKEWAENIYRHTKMTFIPLLSEGRIEKFIQVSHEIEDEIYVKSIQELMCTLQEKGISTYYIRMPQAEELTMNTHNFSYFAGDSFMWRDSNRNYVNQILKYVTDKDYETAKEAAFSSCSIEGKTFGSGGEHRIFLVGSCIVNGWTGFKDDELATILNEKLQGEYEIQCVLMTPNNMAIKHQLLEYDIKENDIVIFLENFGNGRDSDLNVAEIFNNYSGNKWLYYDRPIHTTRYGNELLASEIIKKIIYPYYRNMKEKNERLLHKGSKRLNFQDEENIVEYCNNVSKFHGNNVGAIVMNCNPFTLGHRYLVEQALQHVDELYLFVVEENRSFFSFEHRFKMVKAGVADLKNVEVIPSGKFILSHETFHNYFKKEYLQKVEIDASKDLFIFAEYIAKELNIKIRFVGEEPFDTVTRQYNAQMKKILGDAGIEVLEIPRKMLGSIEISASRVRQCITKQNWQEITQLVPETTMQYLYNGLNISKKRNESELDIYELKMLQNIKDFIYRNSRIILYGTGQNAEALISYLPKNLVVKFEYCDQNAYIKDYEFMGKRVMTPAQLSEIEGDVAILVSSVGHRYSIYDALVKLGVQCRKIYFNLLELNDRIHVEK